MSDKKIDKFVIPKGNKGLRKLNTLYLMNVSINDGSSLLQSLGSFPSLKTLYLASNNFIEPTTSGGYLHNYTNLEELSLDGSSLHISLLHSIAAFTSLQTLSMESCQVNGTLSFQDLPNFKNLTILYMDGTDLSITFPQMIGLMTSLEQLSLSSCGLQKTLSHQG
ncbi:hypothetical protein JRO89_XS01G0066100 [Xanthoceras sorbifolium]|uniref:Uncharacterized protein n=1 Tax=Xanthoceras sorbifolium TaxID=99658 RepID=A0ABQ8IIY0_9ROSI|nr:hypothetical protein JRO89_XS01G0066100 [Xanthoceras sorbifolium]